MPQYNIEGVGLVDIPTGATREQIAGLIAAAEAGQTKTSWVGHAKEALKGIPAGLISGIAAIPEGLGAVTGNQDLKDIGQYIGNNDVTDYLKPSPGYESSIPRQAGEIVGNLLPTIATAGAAAELQAPVWAGRGLAGLMSMSQQAAEQKRDIDKQRAQGMQISPEQETSASRWGSMTGLLDVIPTGPVSRLARFAGQGEMAVARKVANVTRAEVLKDIAKTGISEGITEGGQQFLQNVVKQQVYNPSQDLTEGVPENIIAGGIAGAGLDGLNTMLARRIGRRGNEAAATPQTRTAPPEIPQGPEAAIGIRAGMDMQPEIRYIEALAKAGTGKTMAELSPEAQTVIATKAAELKNLGIPEQQAIDFVGQQPTAPEPASNPTPTPEVAVAPPVSPAATEPVPGPGPGKEMIQPNTADAAGPVAEGRLDPETFRIPTSELNIDPQRFQYKVEGIGQKGVGEELKSVKTWDPVGAGVISVWKDPANGKTYVVNGHHRAELATRLGVPEVRVQYLDAPTAKEARAQGALLNIKEGRGTAIDAAKFMRDTDTTAEVMARTGTSLTGPVARDATALANLTPGLFDDVVHGNFPIKRAVIIGEGLPNHADQLGALAVLQDAESRGKKISDDEFKELIRRTTQAERKTSTQDTLFGVEEMTHNLALEEAQLSNAVRKRLGQEKKLFGMVGKQSAADQLSQTGNTIRAEDNKNIADQAEQALAVYDKLSLSESPISQSIRDGARRLANGESAESVRDSTYANVRNAVSTVLDPKAGVREANASGKSPGLPAVRPALGNTVEQTPSGPQDTLVTDLQARESQLAAKNDRNRPLAEVPLTLQQEDVRVPDPRQDSMFSLADKPAETTPTLTVSSLRKQVEAGEKPQIALDIFSEMRRIGADGIVSTRLVDTLSTPNANGKYADRIISLALASQSPEQLKATLNHEAVHAMREMGLFNDTEWRILSNALNPNTVLSDEERRRYASIYHNNPEAIQEEAIARGLERYSAGTLELAGDAQRAAGQKLSILDRLGSLFKSRDLATPESVGKAFREGAIGRRANPEVAVAPLPAPATTTLDELMKSADKEGFVQPTESTPPEKLSIPQAPVAGRIFAEPDARGLLRKQWDAMVSPPKLKPGQIAPLKGTVRQQALDSRAGIEALSQKAGDLHNARTSAIAATRNADLAENIAIATLKYGALEHHGTPGNGYFMAGDGPHPFGEGGFFTEAYNKGKLDQALHYIAGSRGEKLLSEGREKLLTPQEIATYKSYGNDPEVKAAADQWKIFNDKTVSVLESSGRFDKKTIDEWKKGDFLAFNRFDPETGTSTGPSRATMTSPGQMPGLKGSDRLIGNPIENIVKNVSAITSMAMHNDAILRVARDGLNLGYVKPAAPNAPAKNRITVYQNGKPLKLEVTDQLLYDSVSASKLPASTAMKLAAMPTTFLRSSVTLSPPFMIRNVVRDAGEVWARGYTPFPMADIFDNIGKAYSEGQSFRELERLGVLGSAIRGEGGASGTAENIRGIMDHGSMNALQKTLHWIEDKSSKSEAINRISVYEASMKRTGGDKAQAAQDARELLNFNRRGAHPIVQILTALVPFQNARFQGLDSSVRGVMGAGSNEYIKRKMIARAFYMAGLSSLYTGLVSQLPAWQNASQEERENSWFVPTGNGEAVRVPVPFEFGFFAKVVPERLTAMMMGKEEGKDLLNAFGRFATGVMKVTALPQAISPAYEVFNNKDAFRNQEIESSWMKKLEKNYRVDESTSELAKAIAPHSSLSPVQVDHLLRGYLGTSAMYIANLVDFTMGPSPTGQVADLHNRKGSQMPIFGSMFQREDGPRKLIEYYEIRNAAEQAAHTLKEAHKTRTPVDAVEQQRMGKEAQFERRTHSIDQRISRETKLERQIRADLKQGTLTPAQARSSLEELRKQKMQLADTVIQMKKASQ